MVKDDGAAWEQLYLFEHILPQEVHTAWKELSGIADMQSENNLFMYGGSQDPRDEQVYGITGKSPGYGKLHLDPVAASGINVQGEGSKLWLVIHHDSEENFYKLIPQLWVRLFLFCCGFNQHFELGASTQSKLDRISEDSGNIQWTNIDILADYSDTWANTY
jgi:hypothetical protein